ncbi:hypothetical protein AMTR_s00082p00133770 [Amborella trichopoda]|uniref:Uncharacterized protein n=1 Tax=Amborella trichopoda TaxID=13333 RepID=W1NU43_AMBTC|nr:hypothetical protein AMTR_s00082p00133770 [Amborella trichopoda]
MFPVRTVLSTLPMLYSQDHPRGRPHAKTTGQPAPHSGRRPPPKASVGSSSTKINPLPRHKSKRQAQTASQGRKVEPPTMEGLLKENQFYLLQGTGECMTDDVVECRVIEVCDGEFNPSDSQNSGGLEQVKEIWPQGCHTPIQVENWPQGLQTMGSLKLHPPGHSRSSVLTRVARQSQAQIR